MNYTPPINPLTCTNQEIFDTVCEHFARQGRRAVGNLNICKYRGVYEGERTMCAVGCLISDDEYQEDWEDNGVEAILSDYDEDNLPLILRKRDGETKEQRSVRNSLLDRLQSVHDTSKYGLEDLRYRLKDLAETCSLDASKVDAITSWEA